MEKFALNKYEQYLYSQPKDRVFEDRKVQRAYDNLQRAKQHGNIASGLKEFGVPSDARDAGIGNSLNSYAKEIKKNRGNLYGNTASNGVYPKSEPSVKSPFSTKKDRAGNAKSNDILGGPKNLDKRLRMKDEAEALAKNKFLVRAKNFIKKRPVVSGLLAAGAAGLAGVSAYGWKKQFDQD